MISEEYKWPPGWHTQERKGIAEAQWPPDRRPCEFTLLGELLVMGASARALEKDDDRR